MSSNTWYIISSILPLPSSFQLATKTIKWEGQGNKVNCLILFLISFLKNLFFFFLVAFGLSCIMQDLCCIMRDHALQRMDSPVVAWRLGSCRARASWLYSMWDLHSLTRDATHIPALQGWFLTTGPPGKSAMLFLINTQWKFFVFSFARRDRKC